jgi:wyosine [tRNA(Phe)-imidazoG37] synthetase (radical SAM superfamily)
MNAGLVKPNTGAAAQSVALRADTSSGCPRDFLENRFVYIIFSPRAGGLSLGINLTPNKICNFDCLYCEVNRHESVADAELDLNVLGDELERTLQIIRSGRLRERAPYRTLPSDLLNLRHVALSGDGEPTLSPQFGAVVEKVIHLRARGHYRFLKTVLITNASGLDRVEVQTALQHFTSFDEIWAKLEVGTEEELHRVNRPDCSLQKILSNILSVAQKRPIVIQSLFPSVRGAGPAFKEIEAYAQRLKELKDAGAQISLVQIYSATRASAHSECGHLPLRALKEIARRVREVTALKVEIY